ncbi:MAG TPA: hypothetical protein VGF95_16320 [Solirubrobacteraceae bacterium]|jgi:hypothetical protein
MKTITRMQPYAEDRRAESEDYYLRVHTPFLRRRYRELGVEVVYRTNLVLAQWDHLGGWAHPIDTWRFVQRDIEGIGADLSATTEDERQVRRLIERDHLFFVADMTMYSVEERTLWDRLSKQTSLAKYLFELSEGDRPKHDAKVAAIRLSQALGELAPTLYGLRLLLENRVLCAAEPAALERPGQTFTGRTVKSEALAIYECYFDNSQWGAEALASAQFVELMHDWGIDTVRGYHVLEEVGVDTRQPQP